MNSRFGIMTATKRGDEKESVVLVRTLSVSASAPWLRTYATDGNI